MSVYYKTFTVPKWVLIESSTKAKNSAILEWFKDKDAKEQPWPGLTFHETLLKYKNQGWQHVFTPPTGYPVVIPFQLLAMAVIEHTKKELGVVSPALDFSTTFHRLTTAERTIIKEKDDSYRLYNQVMAMQDQIVLSQVFRVLEQCHDERSPKRYLLWVTVAPYDRSIMTRIADKVIAIGDGEGYDVDVSKDSSKNVHKTLEQYFSQK